MTRLAADFPHLKAYLSTVSGATEALNFEQLLGFLYAVSSAPDTVRVSEWMPIVFADGLPGPGDGAGAERVLAELLALYDRISDEVVECRVELPQECSPLPVAVDNLNPDCGLSRWAQGFSVGHDWLEDVWDGSVGEQADEELDYELGGCTAVLSFFASREMAEALHAEFDSEADSLEDRAEAVLSLLPDALNAYASIGRSLGGGTDAVGAGGGESYPGIDLEPPGFGGGKTRTLH
jgi:yecA family protein